MKSTKVSVIVPVYNVEPYLHACVDSILGQTHTDLQIILVDDGSTDNSGQICDQYAVSDGRVNVIHKHNGGLSSARNAGLPAVEGAFVFYLDSDDYLEPDAISCLLQAQCSSGAEVVVGSYFYTYGDHEDLASNAYERDTMLSRQEAMMALASGKMQNFAWGKLIRTDIAQRHLFPDGKLFEDTFWAHHIIHDSAAVCVMTKPVVHYRQRGGSISYSYTIKRLDALDGWRERLAFLKANYPELVSVYLEHLVPSYLEIAWLTLTRMKKHQRKAFQKLREFGNKYRIYDYASGSSKRTIMLLRTSAALYAVWVAFDRLRWGK